MQELYIEVISISLHRLAASSYQECERLAQWSFGYSGLEQFVSEIPNINCLKLNLTYLRSPILTDLFFHMCRQVFLSWLQFVQCLCILFLFYLTVLIA